MIIEQYHVVIIQFVSMRIKNSTQTAGGPDENERKNEDENNENVLESDSVKREYCLTG